MTQETVLAAWLGIKSFDGQSALKTWLFGIARHKLADFLRRKYRQETEEFDCADLPDEAFIADDIAERTDVERAVAGLSPSERELVFLIFSACLSYAEISSVTGLPEGTVKSRMSGIKNKLRKQLGEGYND